MLRSQGESDRARPSQSDSLSSGAAQITSPTSPGFLVGCHTGARRANLLSQMFAGARCQAYKTGPRIPLQGEPYLLTSRDNVIRSRTDKDIFPTLHMSKRQRVALKS